MTSDLQGIHCSQRKCRPCQWNALRNGVAGSKAKEGSREPGCGKQKQKLAESLDQVTASRGRRTTLHPSLETESLTESETG